MTLLKVGIKHVRKPVATYRDVQRNKELYKKARIVATGVGLMLLGWVAAVLMMGHGGLQ